MAKAKWVGIAPAKYNPNVTNVSIGFEFPGNEKLVYLNLPVAGGHEGQTKFASAALAGLLKGRDFDVELTTNERGYPEVIVPRRDDPFSGDGGF